MGGLRIAPPSREREQLCTPVSIIFPRSESSIKVLLHRPGKELEALTPATLERLLFDDVPYLKIAQEEHDNFARVLRENGVEVVYYVDEVAKAIADPARQIQLVNDFLNISKDPCQGPARVHDELSSEYAPKQMVAELIAGIKRSEVATKEATSLMDLVEDDYPSSPTRCPTSTSPATPAPASATASTSTGCTRPPASARACCSSICTSTTVTLPRRRTSSGTTFPTATPSRAAMCSCSPKTSWRSACPSAPPSPARETFARNLLQNSGFKKVLAFDIPETRAFMHLDTVFTMVDYDKFTIHPEIEGPLSVYEMMLDEHGELKFAALKRRAEGYSGLELKLPAVDLIRCGGGDLLLRSASSGTTARIPSASRPGASSPATATMSPTSCSSRRASTSSPSRPRSFPRPRRPALYVLPRQPRRSVSVSTSFQAESRCRRRYSAADACIFYRTRVLAAV